MTQFDHVTIEEASAIDDRVNDLLGSCLHNHVPEFLDNTDSLEKTCETIDSLESYYLELFMLEEFSSMRQSISRAMEDQLEKIRQKENKKFDFFKSKIVDEDGIANYETLEFKKLFPAYAEFKSNWEN